MDKVEKKTALGLLNQSNINQKLIVKQTTKHHQIKA